MAKKEVYCKNCKKVFKQEIYEGCLENSDFPEKCKLCGSFDTVFKTKDWWKNNV